jgi:hypothetical protein
VRELATSDATATDADAKPEPEADAQPEPHAEHGAQRHLTPPTVSTFVPTTVSPTNAASISYGLTFSESVTGLSASDFSHTGTATGCVVGAPSGSGPSYTVSVGSCSGGTLVLTLNAGTVLDGASNAGPVTSASASSVTIDRTPPGATVIPPASPTNAASLVYGVTFTEPVTGLAAADFSLTGTATGCSVGVPTGSGSSYSVSVGGCSAGTVTMTLKAGSASDAAGNAGPISAVAASSVVIDRTAPTVTVPLTSLRSGTTLSGSSLRVAITWTGADTGGSGVASYDIAQSTDGAAFLTIRTGYTGTWLGVIETPGHSYRFEVRAHDGAGNIGPYAAGPTIGPSLLQQTSTAIVYHGIWTTTTSTVYSGGSARYASAAGAYASYTFSGRSIAAVVSKGPSRGAVKVYIDAVFAATVDCYTTTAIDRFVIFSRTFSAVGTHTIKLVVVGTAGRPRVVLDAFGVLR